MQQKNGTLLQRMQRARSEINATNAKSLLAIQSYRDNHVTIGIYRRILTAHVHAVYRKVSACAATRAYHQYHCPHLLPP